MQTTLLQEIRIPFEPVMLTLLAPDIRWTHLLRRLGVVLNEEKGVCANSANPWIEWQN